MWISRDKDNDGRSDINIYEGKDPPRKELDYYVPIAGSECECVVEGMLPRHFKALFGFTPRKGSRERIGIWIDRHLYPD